MLKANKMKQTFQNKIDISKQSLPIMMMIIYWTLMGILLLQQIKTTDAAKYKGDGCETKSKPGICKEWSECPVIKTLIDRGEYSNREVVTCGFGVKEELICCPVLRTETKIETSSENSTDRFVIENTKATTQAPERDFWMDLLENLNATTSTTAAPDFWLDLLTTPTTTTSTLKPLIVGEQRLNESSEYFDFNALLNGNQGGSQKRQTNTQEYHGHNQQNTGFVNPNNQRRPNAQNTGFISPPNNNNNNNNRGANLNSGPVNLNQWNFEQSSNNERGNNGRGHKNNGNGNNGRGQQNNFRGNNGNNGRGNNGGQHNGNNGRGHNNGNAHSRNVGHNTNQNRGFTFPDNNMRPNQFNDFSDNKPNQNPGRPVNNMNEQNPNRPLTNINENDRVKELIENVFDNSGNPTEQTKPSSGEKLDVLITNIFETPTTQNTQNNPNTPAQNTNNPQPVVWLNPQDNHKPHLSSHMPNNHVEFINPHQANVAFQTIPIMEPEVINNDLEALPSTGFVRQPVVVETWPNNPVHKPEFDPIHMVYENLVNSGMDIVKVEADNVQSSWNQAQSQFGNHPQAQPSLPQFGALQQFVQQPIQPQFGQQPSQQFVQQPIQPQFGQQPLQQFVQQPIQSQLGQPPSQQFIQQPIQPQLGQPPSEQFIQQPIQPQLGQPPSQQFIQQPLQIEEQNPKESNIQSPPTHILDPFKPFEFRPPPEDEINFSEDNNSLRPTNPTKSTTERPAVRACRRIEKGLTPDLTPHILGGTPAELGEFPHMAAIGYSRIGGGNRPPYDIRCGGTLIDKRFVLTAAHCVSDRESVPSIVRLGVVNFTDAIQMQDAVEIRIKETFIHDDYTTRLTYNDIAILELEHEVQTNDIIYPVCLYTNESDPDTKLKLWVSGWGTINTTTRSFSDVLLKAPLHTAPIERCNQSFTEYGLNRRIPEGIIRTQFCAEDKDQVKDACQGDSGGPLHLIVDESYKNYRLVGVVSSGFGCASSTPGLYTRVAAFLDFIERIVWPNGGD